MLIISDLGVGYQNIPKVATTSMFGWLYDCIAFVRTGQPPVKRLDRNMFVGGPGRRTLASSVANEPAALQPYADYYRFALTRDPIRRFLSMYSNRVLFHRELAPGRAKGPVILAAGLEPDPEINLLVDRLEAYCRVQHSILHHCSPMMERMGPDLSVYHRIVDIADVQLCIDDIVRHLAARGHAEAVARVPPLGRSQTGGPKLGLEVLNPYSFEKLLDYYREDYAHIPTVDLQATKAAWHSARAQAVVALDGAVAAALAAHARGGRGKREAAGSSDQGAASATGRKAGGKARAGVGGKAAAKTAERAGARAAAKAAGKAGGKEGRKEAARTRERPAAAGKPGAPSSGAAAGAKKAWRKAELLDLRYPACPLVKVARVNPSSAASALSGVLLLAPQAAEGMMLQLVGPDGPQALAWGMDSPQLLARHADNVHAGRARFRGDKLRPGDYEMRLLAADGSGAWPVARFSLASPG
jgi:hypothetical protein